MLQNFYFIIADWHCCGITLCFSHCGDGEGGGFYLACEEFGRMFDHSFPACCFDLNRDYLPAFYAGGPCEQFWHGHRCPLFDVVHPAFPLPTMASPTLQGALKNGLGEAVVTCDMPEPCQFPSLCVSLGVKYPVTNPLLCFTAMASFFIGAVMLAF